MQLIKRAKKIGSIKFLTVFLAISLVSESYGAIEIETTTERTIDGDKQTYIVHTLLQGLNSRLTFQSPNDADAAKGKYLLSLDGGKTAHYVDTIENTCHQLSTSELGQALGDFMLKTSDRFKIKISDPLLQKVFEKTAEPILGYKVNHIRMELKFNASYKYLLFKDNYNVERSADYWVTYENVNVEATPLYQLMWQYIGSEDFNQQIQKLVRTDIQFLLRSEIDQTMIDKKGKLSRVQIMQYVKSIKEIPDVTPDRFVLPDCKDVGSEEMEKKFKALLKSLIEA